ncbi:hypothetical protein ACPA54_16700 [Uniformispora flossi]|uniref:hypothetical protein n=1 Tax=Uniformispora flossi TaxID=3390723 RepID=UPI003C2FD895
MAVVVAGRRNNAESVRGLISVSGGRTAVGATAAVLVVVTAAGLAGCSKKDAESARSTRNGAPSAPAAPPSAPGSSSAAPPSGPAAADDLCGYLTPAEVSAALGKAVERAEVADSHLGTDSAKECRYQIADVPPQFGAVVVRVAPSAQAAAGGTPADAVPVSGVGEQARWSPGGQQLVCENGGRTVSLAFSVFLQLKDVDALRIATALGRIAVDRVR